jgi:hypothetical protein
MTAVVMIEAVVIALLVVLVLGLLRSHAEILRALHELGVNLDDEPSDGRFRLRSTGDTGEDTSDVAADLREPPPGVVEARRPVTDPAALGGAVDLAGATPDGEMAAVGVVGVDHPTLLAFLSTGCVTCQDFWEAFAAGVALEFDGRPVRLVAVTKGPETESPGAVAALASDGFTTLMSTEAYDDYGVPVSPYFVLVDAHGSAIVGEGAAGSWTQLASLLDRAVADRGAAFAANRTRREVLNGSARQRRVDRELDAAGIGPDHPSVHP